MTPSPEITTPAMSARPLRAAASGRCLADRCRTDRSSPHVLYLGEVDRVVLLVRYLLANKTLFGVSREVDTSDFHVEAIDLLGNHVAAEIGVAFFVAAYSILRKVQPQPAMLVLGDMSIQGNIKAVRSLVEPLQVAMDNGAKRALIPIENKRNFLDVSGDILENIDPVFYGDVQTASSKALGLN